MSDNTDIGKILATQGVPPEIKSECEQADEAKKKGIEEYDDAKENRRTEETKQKFEDKARAIAGAFVQTTKKSFTNKVLKMISCHSASASFNRAFEAGQKKGTIIICDGKKHTFGEQRHTQFGCHAETKLISALAKQGLLKKAKITFNIFWKNQDGISNIPCLVVLNLCVMQQMNAKLKFQCVVITIKKLN